MIYSISCYSNLTASMHYPMTQGKQDVRQVRKEAIDHVKKLKGSVSEDHLKRYTKDIEAVMEKKIEKIVKILKDKEVELMK